MSLEKEALEYHSTGRKGKIEVRSTKPTRTQKDLSLAYSPGVAEPCRVIAKEPDKSFDYTARGNLVAVISNGTAVLGLGDIGPLASKPVMEGKGVLFKTFADIDVFDLEVDAKDPEEFIDVVKTLGPSFGGINLEDIKAPDCYVIESRLREIMDIPVFHDDQHGTAIIAAAGLLNALEITGKNIANIRCVFNGAGAAAISCARLFRALGVHRENILMLDSKGLIFQGRTEGMNVYKEEFQVETRLRTLEEALRGADVFAGLSTGGVVSKEMVQSMAKDPIIFALANPDPEISYDDAKAARDDAIVGTGRSDTPNQINNVLGFPFLFRGALDVRATDINEEMKMAAVHALADLAKEDVPADVVEAYDNRVFRFGRDYLIPKPFDRRLLVRVSSAVAEAAMKSGVARMNLDLDEYRRRLERLLGRSSQILRSAVTTAQHGKLCRILLPEGEEPVILEAAERMIGEGIGRPVLFGREKTIRKQLESAGVRECDVDVIDPAKDDRSAVLAERLYQLRKYKGLRQDEARKLIKNPLYFAMMMLEGDDGECLLAGIRHTYADTIRPALQIIRVKDWLKKVSGLYIISVREKLFFFADTTVNVDPCPDDLASIAICAAETASRFGSDPRVALLSFSNDGSTDHASVRKVREALRLVRERFPDLRVEGDIAFDAAIDPVVRKEVFPGSKLDGSANVLVFPDLNSANIAYKMMLGIGGALGIGPIIMGIRKPVNVIPQGSSATDIVNLAAVTVMSAQGADGAALP